MEMEASEKVEKQRLSVLELAEQLGNITEACRRRGMDRTMLSPLGRASTETE